MLIQNNFTAMNYSPYINEGDMDSTSTRIRINVEFLDSCKFNCAGCYVKRKNEFSDEDLDILTSTVDMFRSTGAVFDEIIVGPTDFFGASNTEEVITNPKFKSIFEDGSVVMTVLTTLQEDERRIIRVNRSRQCELHSS